MRLGIAVFAIVCLLVAGCGGGSQLVGKWQDTMTGKVVMEFKSDGQVTMSMAGLFLQSLPYKVRGNRLTTGPGQGLDAYQQAETDTFTISGDTLTLGTGARASVWKRTK